MAILFFCVFDSNCVSLVQACIYLVEIPNAISCCSLDLLCDDVLSESSLRRMS